MDLLLVSEVDLGCFHLFLAGYLHRDISIGNVLRRKNLKTASSCEIITSSSPNRVTVFCHVALELQLTPITSRFAFMNDILDSCSGFLSTRTLP